MTQVTQNESDVTAYRDEGLYAEGHHRQAQHCGGGLPFVWHKADIAPVLNHPLLGASGHAVLQDRFVPIASVLCIGASIASMASVGEAARNVSRSYRAKGAVCG